MIKETKYQLFGIDLVRHGWAWCPVATEEGADIPPGSPRTAAGRRDQAGAPAREKGLRNACDRLRPP